MSNKNITILIVDDNISNLELLGNILKNKNYRLAFAKNGKDALKLSEKINPDLVLLDIMMPEMDGYEVCRNLKDNINTREIPVIFLTAKTETEDLVKGFNIGGVDFITKPFNKDELYVRINTHIELKLAKEKLKKQAIELKKTNDTKDKLFSIISHDLRGPLGGIKNMVDLLISEYRSDLEFTGKSLYILKQTSEKTEILLENLLFWSKNQKGEIAMNPQIINIKATIDDIVVLMQATANDKNIIISTEIDDNISCFADIDMIKTVVRNLINNAIKFTHKNGKITISAKNQEKNVCVYIKDNGIGIGNEIINKIFDKDDYYTSYGTSKEKGSGLGLNLCIDFIKKNKGEFNIKSEINKGSIFSFCLPKVSL